MIALPYLRRSAERYPLAACVSLGLLVFVGLMLLRASGRLQAFELLAYDQHLRWRVDAPVEQRIALVGVTEADIREFGWPLSDRVLAQLLEKLIALEPRAIGLDIYRDIPIPPGKEQLDAVLLRHPQIFAVMKFGARADERIEPPAVLRGAERSGFADMVVDSDGVARRGLLFLDDGAGVHYSLGLRLALRYLEDEGIYPRSDDINPDQLKLAKASLRPFEADEGGYVGADAAGYQVLLNFNGGDFSRYSLADVFSGAFDASKVRGKVIVVGVTADSVKDFFQVPAGSDAQSDSRLFGIALHAHLTSQLLAAALDGENAIASFDDRAEAFWMLCWCLAGALLGYQLRALLRFSLTVALGLVVLAAIAQTAFEFGWWIPTVPPGLGWLLAAALATSWMSYQQKEQRRLVMQLFSKHVSSGVAELIWRQRDEFVTGDGRLRPQKLTATVLFSDLVEFTALSEKLGPQALMDWLNAYLDTMTRLVTEHRGVVNKFIGDAVMAVFGAPLPSNTPDEIARDARNAVHCALAMGRELERLNALRETDGAVPAAMRIGIFTGAVIAGSLGSRERMEYTVLGDTVNTAERLESYDKRLSAGAGGVCRILIGPATLQYLDDEFDFVPVGRLRLKGKAEEIAVYAVIGLRKLTQAKLTEEAAK